MPSEVFPQAGGGAYDLTGGGNSGYWLSGLPAPSGNASSFDATGFETSGPWYIATQRLSFDYVRIPRFDYRTPDASAFTLSGHNNPQAWGSVALTNLACHAVGQVAVMKSTDDYFTSSYQQPQKFALYAVSADPYGQRYGALTAGTFGPMGEVITRQPYFHRRLWRATDVSPTGIIAQSFSFRGNFGGSPAMLFQDWRKGMGFQTDWINMPGFLPGCTDMSLIGAIVGAWNPNRDHVSQLEATVNLIGAAFQFGGGSGRSIMWDALGSPQDGLEGWYNITRHDFS